LEFVLPQYYGKTETLPFVLVFHIFSRFVRKISVLYLFLITKQIFPGYLLNVAHEGAQLNTSGPYLGLSRHGRRKTQVAAIRAARFIVFIALPLP
jgi:hypothetical protein